MSRYCLAAALVLATAVLSGCNGGAAGSTDGLAAKQRNDNTPAPANVCERHHLAMRPKKVPIRYGDPIFTAYDDALYREEIAQFPHAPDYFLGGCVIPLFATRQREALECPECRRLKTSWLLAHPPSK